MLKISESPTIPGQMKLMSFLNGGSWWWPE